MAFNWLKKIGKNVAYYPGCLTNYVLASEAGNYRRILEKIKVDFIVVPEHLCCGSPVLNAGYEKDARTLARKNLELFKKYNVRKIITNCPACFKTFLKDYAEMLPDWDIEVEHVITPILNYLRKKNIDKENTEKIAYHDPCHLGRHLGIYDEPREILERLGFEIVEMRNNKADSLCCGGGAGLRVNNPKLASDIAKERVKQARESGVKKIVTTCPLCFAHVKEAATSLSTPKSNSDKQGLRGMAENSNIEVVEFSHLVAEKLGISVEKTDLKREKEELKEACS